MQPGLSAAPADNVPSLDTVEPPPSLEDLLGPVGGRGRRSAVIGTVEHRSGQMLASFPSATLRNHDRGQVESGLVLGGSCGNRGLTGPASALHVP